MRSFAIVAVMFLAFRQSICDELTDCSQATSQDQTDACASKNFPDCLGLTAEQFKQNCCEQGQLGQGPECKIDDAFVGGCLSVSDEFYEDCVDQNAHVCNGIPRDLFGKCCNFNRHEEKYERSSARDCPKPPGQQWLQASDRNPGGPDSGEAKWTADLATNSDRDFNQG